MSITGQAPSPFQPMETAPHDGREILIRLKPRHGMPPRHLVGHWMPGGFCIEDHPAIERGWYFWNGHQFDRASEPDAWMDIPEARR